MPGKWIPLTLSLILKLAEESGRRSTVLRDTAHLFTKRHFSFLDLSDREGFILV